MINGFKSFDTDNLLFLKFCRILFYKKHEILIFAGSAPNMYRVQLWEIVNINANEVDDVNSHWRGCRDINKKLLHRVYSHEDLVGMVSSILIYLHILKLTGEIAKLLTLLFDETNFSSGTVYSHTLIKCKHYLQISVFIGVSQELP